MTLAEPLPEVATQDRDDDLLPTRAQQALAEKRLAEMLADPSKREPLSALLAYLNARA